MTSLSFVCSDYVNAILCENYFYRYYLLILIV